MRKIFGFILTLLFLVCVGSLAAQDDFSTLDTTVSIGVAEGAKQGTFSTVTQTAPVVIRKLPAEKVAALQKSDDYWYANFEPPKKEEPKPSKSVFNQDWLQNLLWIIILCSFIGVVIWYLASSNVALFRRESKTIATDDEAGEIPDDIFSIGYEKEITKAVAAGNFRLAVRLWYLRTLKELSDRSLIAYRPEKPDGDYVLSLYGSRYYRDFFQLTRAFEYTWYGQFALTAETYQSVQASFQQFKNSLSA